ncbi:DUF6528 family protein [Glycomyces sp. TRM65418]|uniref:DUF6528 family protein n=1 Tax=Glycomyces sp. TRM65418 TaxID=2867006 RepID=UPI001CE5BA77|nr:DUF6528 family protein [Glycomyces sp. TRM65418]MCC3763889.1 DUF6528 family protein [Glycomyces sp. TRM65418]QZD53592.1 hypothetical protein K3N28_12455 [Glycomyces sp. TRM65418]
MNRRNFLRAVAVGAPLATAGVIGAGVASAETANFKVMVTEQVTNKVYVFDKSKSFSNADAYKTWSPGTGGWSNLSDCRIRNTAEFGVIGLAAASGGRVGIWDVTNEKDQELNDVLWSAAPGGNPHALERIPNLGAFVAASSDGFLTVYAPTKIADPSTLAKVQTVSLAGAHGVVWDPNDQLLWACGDKIVQAYTVSGAYRNIRLKASSRKVTLSGLGHDLQPDYSNTGRLLVSDTYGVYSIDKSSLAKSTLHTTTRVKSYVKMSTGEYFYVRGDNAGSRTWGSPTVVFSQSADRTRSGAEFYKARYYATAYN